MRHGATVAVMDWDSHRYLESYFAIPMMGATLAVNVRLAQNQIAVAYTLNDSEAEIVLVHADFVPLGAAYVQRVISLLELIDALDAHETRFSVMVADKLVGHAGYQAIQQLPGVGPILGAVFVAEIGDVHRFADPARLCSWAGLTPRHHESDTVVRRGHITKQGSKLVRWAAVEAIQRHPTTSKIALDRTRIESRRGKNIAKIAVARKLLTLVYYGLRDGHIRALAPRRAA